MVSKGDIMDLHDYMNIRSILRMMAMEWGCPVWMVKRVIRQTIDRCWEKAMLDPQEKALWDKYFPSGKPTPDQYILRLGHAYETGEAVPYLLKD